VSSLFRRIIGERFDALPRGLRAIHEGELPRSFSGTCRVDRGSGWLSRLCGSLARLPPAADSVPVRVSIRAFEGGERWDRDFGGCAMRSELRERAGELEERVGAAVLRFALEPGPGSIRWRLTGARALGIPLPLAWFRGVQAIESMEQGRYRFDVRAEFLPAGLLVHYRGSLDAES
jgi:hypothetical protein